MSGVTEQYSERSSWLVGVVRGLLREQRSLYRWAGRLYHSWVLLKERLYLLAWFRDVEIINLSRREVAALRAKGFQSQYGQDYYLVQSDLVPRGNGSFLDIGCNDPWRLSNSFYFERYLGFSGVCVDPVADEKKWKKERPASRMIRAVVSDVEGELEFIEVKNRTGWETMLSGPAETLDLSGKGMEYSIRKVSSISLDRLIEEYFDDAPDVMTVDVEGHEEHVLRSFSWEYKKPKVVIVENFGPLRKQRIIRMFMLQKGYQLRARVWISDDIYVLKGDE